MQTPIPVHALQIVWVQIPGSLSQLRLFKPLSSMSRPPSIMRLPLKCATEPARQSRYSHAKASPPAGAPHGQGPQQGSGSAELRSECGPWCACRLPA